MDTGTLSVIGILIGVICLVLLSYKGIPPIFVAPLSAVIVLVFSQQNVITGIIDTYMAGFAAFAGKYYLVFLTGAIFGSIMGDSGAARSIGLKFARTAKRSKSNAKLITVLSIVAVSTILAYGGVSAFVAMFTIIVVAKELYREMDVPWGLYGCQILGSGCIAMSMLPGSPSIPNIVASTVLNTTPMAAPILGLLCAGFALCLGIIYISWELKRAAKNQEGFFPTGVEIATTITVNENFKEMHIIRCLTPSVVLILVLNVLNQHVVVATLCAIILAIVLFWNQLGNILESAKVGSSVAVNSICVASMVVAFGSVVSNSPGFGTVISFLDKVPGPPIVQLIISVNIAAGITGSASGGLTIAMNSLSQRFLEMGINPDIIHRVACISSGGLDSLPHNGSIINELSIAKLTHKTGYCPMGVCSVVIPILTVIFGVILSQIGII